MDRRQILMTGAVGATLLAIPPLLSAGRARAATGEIFEDDRILGAADAPVTIIEYSSLTCPHCAALHKHTLPLVKEHWIESGRARLVYRHFPLDGLALRAALLADCFEGERHFSMLEALFSSQQRWARADDPIVALAGIAKLAGLDQAGFESCIADEARMDRILERAQDGKDTYGISSTPTLIVNGRKLEGAQEYETFDKVLEEAATSS